MFRLRNFLFLTRISGQMKSSNLVNTHIKWYTTEQLDTQLIENVLKDNKKLSQFGQGAVERAHNVFKRAGFTPENSLKMIDRYPLLVCLSPKQIENRLEMWHICQFSKTQFYDLFVQCPEFLDVNDENYIAKRFSEIQSIVGKPKNVWRLMVTSPNVVFDDWKMIKKKIDYILDEMQADVTDLVKSGSLALPMNKIKTRHELLVRLGIYKKKNIKASELDQNKNPRLFRIMDSSDREFTTKICGISINEFEAFCELFERELEEKVQEKIDYQEDSDLESDDDENEPDNDFDARETGDYYDDRQRRRYRKPRRYNKDVE